MCCEAEGVDLLSKDCLRWVAQERLARGKADVELVERAEKPVEAFAVDLERWLLVGFA